MRRSVVRSFLLILASTSLPWLAVAAEAPPPAPSAPAGVTVAAHELTEADAGAWLDMVVTVSTVEMSTAIRVR